jgi:hypothetical protein
MAKRGIFDLPYCLPWGRNTRHCPYYIIIIIIIVRSSSNMTQEEGILLFDNIHKRPGVITD